MEITPHCLIQYRLPTTGEMVPLLQIAPSKTDAERLLVVSPELTDVLSAIIMRVRHNTGRVPLVPAYDWHECVWQSPAPVLFQRRFGIENRAISHGTIRKMIKAALATPDSPTQPPAGRSTTRPTTSAGSSSPMPSSTAYHRTSRKSLRPPGHQRHLRLQGRLPGRGHPGPPHVPRPSPKPAPDRGIPRPDRRGMAGVPRPLRAPQSRHRTLRSRLLHPVHPRARLPALLNALARPGSTATNRRDPRQPHRPDRRSRTRRLARRGRRTPDQPRRRQRQARPDRPPPPGNRG